MAEKDLNTQIAERAHDRLVAGFDRKDEAAIRIGESAIRSVILANGGAVVAVLAFLGNIAGKPKVTVAQVANVAGSLTCFAAGVAAGLICMVFAYLVNFHQAKIASSFVGVKNSPYVEQGPETAYYRRVSAISTWAGMTAGAASLLLFIGGIYDVRNAIQLLQAVVAE